ncbi:MAG: acyltransferase [Pseudomonadota bacterium]
MGGRLAAISSNAWSEARSTAPSTAPPTDSLIATYRPDIDGLRALAVLPVVLFHAGVPGFAGGFVGVDVFFVISGFLITSIVAAELANGTFSIRSFYLRRIRRLFPALFSVVLISCGLAYWLLMPAELEDFGESVIATSLFGSNFLFNNEAGYFDGPRAGTKAPQRSREWN